MYEFADKAIEYLNGRLLELFSNFKASLVLIDEINLLQSVKSLFKEIDDLVKEMMYNIAVYAYENADGDDISHITDTFLSQTVFEEYDPVLKYVYENELERKCSRLFESLVATGYEAAEVDTALRYLSVMISQYAITVTDVATLQAYKDNDVTEVEWVCVGDGHECKVCHERNGTVYLIEDVPPKPHIGCRCYIIPYREE